MEKEVFVDGSYSPVFGSAYCIVGIKKKTSTKIVILEKSVSSKHAEYQAILNALRSCQEETIIFSDCIPVIMEILTKEIANEISNQELLTEARKLITEKRVILKWIRREENKAGRKLEERLNTLRSATKSMYPSTSRFRQMNSWYRKHHKKR